MRPPFVAVPRMVLDSPWYRDASPFTRSLYLLLLSLANYKPGTTSKGEQLEPGQLVTSWEALRERMAWTEKGRRVFPTLRKVRWAGYVLKDSKVTSWRVTGGTRGFASGRGILVTLLGWDLYANDAGGTSRATSRATSGSTSGVQDVPHVNPIEKDLLQDVPRKKTATETADEEMRANVREWERLEKEGREPVH